jgi:hypothetical protein
MLDSPPGGQYTLKIMITKASVGGEPRRFPAAMRLGFLLLGLGLGLDLAYHAALALGGGHASHSSVFATSVHVVVLVGMAVTFGGLLQVAIRPQRAVNRKERQ